MRINAYHYYLMVIVTNHMATITRTHSNLIMHDICLLYEHINYARHNVSNDTLITHLITIAFLVIRKISYSLV